VIDWYRGLLYPGTVEAPACWSFILHPTARNTNKRNIVDPRVYPPTVLGAPCSETTFLCPRMDTSCHMLVSSGTIHLDVRWNDILTSYGLGSRKQCRARRERRLDVAVLEAVTGV
jgi:hypothetical protein